MIAILLFVPLINRLINVVLKTMAARCQEQNGINQFRLKINNLKCFEDKETY